jgi:hypothetical protein
MTCRGEPKAESKTSELSEATSRKCASKKAGKETKASEGVIPDAFFMAVARMAFWSTGSASEPRIRELRREPDTGVEASEVAC